MPRKPKRPCSFPGCPALAIEGKQYCTEHQRQENTRYDRYVRDPEVRKKYGRAWKRIRDRYAAEHPLCERCLAEGRTTLLDEVHHILPVSRGGSHNTENLMSLCRSCHQKIHMEMGDR